MSNRLLLYLQNIDDTLRSEAMMNVKEYLKPDYIAKSQSTHTADYERTVHALSTFSLDILYALSINNEELHRFFTNNEKLQVAWEARLRALNAPDKTITSINGEKSVSLFSQLMGFYLMHQYEKYTIKNQDSLAILNKACELGSFKALIARLNLHADEITAERMQKYPTEIETNIKQAIQDTATIGNLYWSIGCIDAAMILFKIAEAYFKHDPHIILVERFFMPAQSTPNFWSTQYDVKCPTVVVIIEAAMENLYIAKLLKDHPNSVRVTNAVSNGVGLLVGYEKIFKSEEDLQKQVLHLLDVLHFPLISTFCDNAINHALATIKIHLPDFSPQQTMSL